MNEEIEKTAQVQTQYYETKRMNKFASILMPGIKLTYKFAISATWSLLTFKCDFLRILSPFNKSNSDDELAISGTWFLFMTTYFFNSWNAKE